MIGLPVLWVAGEQDVKFRNLANEMGELSRWIHPVVVPGVGHRVLADAPAALRGALEGLRRSL